MLPRRLILLGLVAILGAGCGDGGSRGGAVGLDGSAVDPLASEATVVVLLFARTDCPISNRYAPEIKRLVETYGDRGVDTWLVYPNSATTVEQITAHMKEYRFRCNAARDPRHALVDRAGASMTPEAAVFDASREMIYCGRIDDRYVDFGQARPEPTKRDLEDAIQAALTGGAVMEARTKAIGCFIADLPREQ